MKYKYNFIFISLSAFIFICLHLLSPSWLKIMGSGPCWYLIWLLPWSIQKGQYRSFLAAFSMGLICDSLTIDTVSNMPGLLILSFCYSRLGKKRTADPKALDFAVICWISSICFGLSLWIQQLLFQLDVVYPTYNIWAVKYIFSQAFITSILAILLCPLLFIFFKRFDKSY